MLLLIIIMIDISFPDHSCGLSFDDTYLPEALKYSYNNEIEKSKIIIDKAKISIGLFAANGVFAFLNAFNIDSEKYVQKTKKVDELLKILFDDTIPKQIKEETINLFSLPREEVMEIAEIQNVRELLNGISIVLIAVAFLGTLLSLSFSVKINTTSRKKSHQTMFPPEISHDNRFSSSETNENYMRN